VPSAGPDPSVAGYLSVAGYFTGESLDRKSISSSPSFLVSLTAASDVAEAVGRMAAGARPRISFRLFNMSELLGCENENDEDRHKLHWRDLHSSGGPG